MRDMVMQQLLGLRLFSDASRISREGLMRAHGSPQIEPTLQNMGLMTFVSYHSFKQRISLTLNGGAFGRW